MGIASCLQTDESQGTLNTKMDEKSFSVFVVEIKMKRRRKSLAIQMVVTKMSEIVQPDYFTETQMKCVMFILLLIFFVGCASTGPKVSTMYTFNMDDQIHTYMANMDSYVVYVCNLNDPNVIVFDSKNSGYNLNPSKESWVVVDDKQVVKKILKRMKKSFFGIGNRVKAISVQRNEDSGREVAFIIYTPAASVGLSQDENRPNVIVRCNLKHEEAVKSRGGGNSGDTGGEGKPLVSRETKPSS
jgi:hypothetical protein